MHTTFICKQCGELSPIGVGYAATGTAAQRLKTHTIVSCKCGHSRHALAEEQEQRAEQVDSLHAMYGIEEGTARALALFDN